MKKTKVLAFVLAFLCCCVLAGCADMLKKEDMDQEVERLIAALNEDDADAVFQSMYPGVVSREEFDDSYETIQSLWERSDEHTTKLRSISTNKNFDKFGESLVCKAQYYVYTQDQSYTITLTYRSDDIGEGIYRFDLNVGAHPVLISGGITTASENSALQWGLLILSALCYVFVIATVVDILRKRPRLYGVWLVAALVFLGFQIQAAPGSFHLGGHVSALTLSAFKIFTGGRRLFVFAVPVGVIVYWCMRKKLLSQKFKI
ncbi:MAG: hypothetical protein K1W23_08220 [Lachnospiraceae bacterium]|jgi:hypothetical protein